MRISAESLAYWYLPLNGFLGIRNFIVHPDTGPNQRIDVEILAVRSFPRGESLATHARRTGVHTPGSKSSPCLCRSQNGGAFWVRWVAVLDS